MKSLVNGFGSGFGRAIGRIFAYLILGYVIYLLLKTFDIDISKYINILRGGIF